MRGTDCLSRGTTEPTTSKTNTFSIWLYGMIKNKRYRRELWSGILTAVFFSSSSTSSSSMNETMMEKCMMLVMIVVRVSQIVKCGRRLYVYKCRETTSRVEERRKEKKRRKRKDRILFFAPDLPRFLLPQHVGTTSIDR